MSERGYHVSKDFNKDIYYLLKNDGSSVQESLEYFLFHNLSPLLGFIESTQSPSTLLYYWDKISTIDKPIDYKSQGQELLFSFVSNDMLPQEIIRDVVENATVLKDDALGVEPYVAHMFARHLNSTDELVGIYHQNFDDTESVQSQFDNVVLSSS